MAAGNYTVSVTVTGSGPAPFDKVAEIRGAVEKTLGKDTDAAVHVNVNETPAPGPPR